MQKKFLGPVFTLVALAVLLILHFTGLFTLQFLPTLQQLIGGQPAPGDQLQWWYKCADGTWIADLSNCPGGALPPDGEENCGSVDNTHLLVNPDEQTAAEKAAIVCFNEKMLACSAGNIELTGQNGGTYSVKGKADENCSISLYSASTSEEKTCAIPAPFITEGIAAAEDAAKPEMMLVMLGFTITFESYTDTRTNEKTVLSCTKQQNI